MTTSKSIALVLTAALAAGSAHAASAATPTPTAKSSSTPATTSETSPATAKPAASTARHAVSAKRAAVAKPSASKSAAAPAKAGASPPAPADAKAPDDSTMTLRGGQEGTVFRSLTVEGEDRIHYEVARPELKLDADPTKVSGLEWGSARDVLDRTTPDEMAPLVAGSALEQSPYTARPWLSHFASGTVATFHPDVEHVDHWKLTVADWRGQPVATFSGKGDPPKDLAWDGRAANGAPVMPGATYSYVFEAVDRAGNHRHFVGDGFRVNAFRVERDGAMTLVFTGGEMNGAGGSGAVAGGTSPLVLEAASWLNQVGATSSPITVTATGRTSDEATSLGRQIQQQLSPLLIGDAARIRVETRTASDAPPGGTASIVTGKATAVAESRSR